jgi:hypothetical protein
MNPFLFVGLIFISTLSFAEVNIIDTNKVAIGTNRKGRLGNALISYINCKYLSYKYNIPFLYRPFPFSDQFAFHDKEIRRELWEPLFQNNRAFEGVEDFQSASTFLVVPYFREGPLAHRWKLCLYPDWKDKEFIKLIRESLKPRFDFATVDLPTDTINIVLHVRRGGDFDNLETIRRLPVKFPSDEYFIETLKKVSEFFNNHSIYAHIMTDDLHPERLLTNYKNQLVEYKNITLGFKKLGIMEDFFSIPKFDCIIRGDSTFSIVASILGNFILSVSVVDARCKEGKNVVLKSHWEINYQHPYFLQ